MPFYRLRRREPPKTSILECVLAFIGALFMILVFIACVAVVR